MANLRVAVSGQKNDVDALLDANVSLPRDLILEPWTPQADVTVHLTEAQLTGLFRIHRMRGVFISRDQASEISSYAQIDERAFLILSAYLGVIQWRALTRNAMLREEDFRHPRPSRCLFADMQSRAMSALCLEHPMLCWGCMQFYRCLGLELEIGALLDWLPVLGQPSRAA